MRTFQQGPETRSVTPSFRGTIWTRCLSPTGPDPVRREPSGFSFLPDSTAPATVSVWATKRQPAIRLRVSDLNGPAGSVTANNIDVRVVRTIRGLPAFLEKRPALDIPEGRTRTFWLTLYVPPDTAPGYYRGQIEVTPQQGEPTRRDLLLRVLPLRLPPAQKGYGFWWAMDRRWNGYETKDPQKALEMIRKHFILLREHNCNMVSIHAMPKMSRTTDGTVQLDFARDHWGHNAYSPEDFFRLGRQTKFLSPQVPIQFPGADNLHTDRIAREMKLDRNSPAFDEFYRHACRRIDAWVKSQGFTLAFACVDEIGNSQERRQTRACDSTATPNRPACSFP